MFRCHDASGERYYVTKYTLVANTWKHIEIVVPGNSALVFNDDNGEGLEVRWNLSAGDDRNDATADTWFAPGSDYDQSTNTQVNFFDSTDNNFFLTGVQLEVGDVASGFEHIPHDVQLQRCKRYYEKIQYEGQVATMAATSTSAAYARIESEVEKRADPSVTLPTTGQSTNQISVLSGAGSYPSTTGSHAVGNPTPLGFRLQASSYDSLETGGGLMLYVNGTVNIEFDAEL
jgi:hypothetical protein